MKKNLTETEIPVEGASPVFWIFLSAAAVALVFFCVRQVSSFPVDTALVRALVLDESKEKASGIKKYFPKPYSVNDLARGDYDRH